MFFKQYVEKPERKMHLYSLSPKKKFDVKMYEFDEKLSKKILFFLALTLMYVAVVKTTPFANVNPNG